MSKGSVAPLIKEYYPEYYMLKEYPVGSCAVFKTTKEKWGILGNFARTGSVSLSVSEASSLKPVDLR